MTFVDDVRMLGEESAAHPAAHPALFAPEARKHGLRHFAENGLPTRRHEEWKYTPVRFLDEREWPLAPAPDEARFRDLVEKHALPGAVVLVVADGRYLPGLSRIDASGLPRGVVLGSLAEAVEKKTVPAVVRPGSAASVDTTPFVALNTGLAQGGAVVFVPKNASVTPTVQILVLSGERRSASYPRHLIFLEEGAQAQVVETWAGAAPADDAETFTAGVTEVVLAANASLTLHTCCCGDVASGYRIGSLVVKQARGSRFTSHAFWLGGRFSRHDLQVALEGEGAEAHLYGLYVLGDDQHADSHTVIDHRVPRCTSRQLYKGVLGGEAHGVFNGKVYFRAGAEKSDTEQANHNLLLTAGAEIDTKPQLEIWADDVKASHGSTVGQLDDEAVFYLRSRGIPAPLARRLLTFAFTAEMLEAVTDSALLTLLRPALDDAMGRALAGTEEGAVAGEVASDDESADEGSER